MDVQYLSSRYGRGEAAVSQFMEEKHRYVEPSTTDMQADFLTYQGQGSNLAGTSARLAPIALSQNSVFRLRLTIVWIDASCVPSRCLLLAFVFEPGCEVASAWTRQVTSQRALQT